MAKYNPDCSSYDSRHQKVRPYCHQFKREIRPSDCTPCTFYKKVSEVMAEVDPAVIRLLKNRTREELGLETLTDEDYKGEDGEAIDAARRGK